MFLFILNFSWSWTETSTCCSYNDRQLCDWIYSFFCRKKKNTAMHCHIVFQFIFLEVIIDNRYGNQRIFFLELVRPQYSEDWPGSKKSCILRFYLHFSSSFLYFRGSKMSVVTFEHWHLFKYQEIIVIRVNHILYLWTHALWSPTNRQWLVRQLLGW